MILCIDTASPKGGVALAGIDGQVVVCQWVESLRHSELLWPSVLELLKNQSLSLSDLSSVAIVTGPGGMTGLRVGATVAKSLCATLNVPMLAVSAHEQIAHPTPAVVVIPIGRHGYSAGFVKQTEQGALHLIEHWGAREDELITRFKEMSLLQPPRFVGPGALTLQPVLEARWPGSVPPDPQVHQPHLTSLAAVAKIKSAAATHVESDKLELIYDWVK